MQIQYIWQILRLVPLCNFNVIFVFDQVHFGWYVTILNISNAFEIQKCDDSIQFDLNKHILLLQLLISGLKTFELFPVHGEFEQLLHLQTVYFSSYFPTTPVIRVHCQSQWIGGI